MAGLPVEQGLYDPSNEHDACGVGFVVNIRRPAVARYHPQRTADPDQPHASGGVRMRSGNGRRRRHPDPDSTPVFRARVRQAGFHAAACGCLRRGHGVSACGADARGCRPRESWSGSRAKKGLTVLGWRDTPVEVDAIGRVARASQPYIEQIFIARRRRTCRRTSWSASCTWCASARNRKSRLPISRTKRFFYIPSLSSRTIVYKGLLLASQISRVLPGAERSGDGERAVHGAPALLHQHVSRPGNWRIPTGICATTAKSTPFAATSTGCTRARRC